MATLNLTTYFTEYGEPKTGLSPTVTVWDVSDGSVIVNAQAMTELAGGWYKYSFATFDLTKDYVARAYGGAGQPSGERYAPIDMAGAALSGKIDALETKIDTIDGIVDSILEDTGTTIPATITTAQNDLDIITGATGVNLLAATQASIDAIEADTDELQSNQSNWATATGFATEAKQDIIDTVVDAVKAKTDNLKDTWNDLSAAQVNAECDTALSDYDGPTKAEMDTALGNLNDIAVADILAGVVEGSITIQHALAVILAKAAGQGTGGGTETLVYKNQAGDTARITYAVTSQFGNRTTTIDVSDL